MNITQATQIQFLLHLEKRGIRATLAPRTNGKYLVTYLGTPAGNVSQVLSGSQIRSCIRTWVAEQSASKLVKAG